jgi:tetratricopeptide (TPR) repeat protein
MAEGSGIEGLLGSEPDERESGSAAPGADAVALSLALQKTAHDPELSRTASEYLVEQRRLVQLQIKHFDEERRLAIAAAKRKRYADRIRNTLSTLVALIVLGLVVAISRMTIEAVNDHSLVVEGFTVPPDLAARGASSQALAENLVSRLAAIRSTANRHSLSWTEEVRSDQAGSVKIEIPQTGVSLDELEHFAHRWLGHQILVNGAVRNEADGDISIGLRIAGAEPIEVRGPSADLDRLIQETAERAFASFDPINYVIYLMVSGRGPDALNAAELHARSSDVQAGSPQESADAYSLWGGADPDPHRALSRALIAIDLDPRVFVGWIEAARASAQLGHDQAANDFYRKVFDTKIEDQPPQLRGGYAHAINEAHTEIDRAMGDTAALDADNRGHVAPIIERFTQRARVAAALHDEAHSREELARALAAGPAGAAVRETRWYVSSAAGDWPQALRDAKALVDEETAKKSAAPGPDWAGARELALQTVYRPSLAYAELMNSEGASAAALMAQSPTDCYLCVRIRALIAAAAGDPVGADRWFAEAVRQAPDLPMAYWQWGQTMLARGDLAGAAKQLARAHEKGPHCADPLKAWGDVLVKQGRPGEALAKYDEALKYAPNWKELKEARETAAKQKT